MVVAHKRRLLSSDDDDATIGKVWKGANGTIAGPEWISVNQFCVYSHSPAPSRSLSSTQLTATYVQVFGMTRQGAKQHQKRTFISRDLHG